MQIIHISDLHFTNVRFNDATKNFKLCYSVKKLISEKEPDLVIVSGDISDDGNGTSLINARDWLVDRFDIGNKIDIGLSIDPRKLIVVPGNKDIKYEDYLDKDDPRIFEVYNSVFSNHIHLKFDHQDTMRYFWGRINDVNLFIAYLNTSYLGKDHKPSTRIDRREKSKQIHCQSKTLVNWFDSGFKGELLDNYGEKIDKNEFKNSVKILVMHHYLFNRNTENKGYFINENHRKIVFQNMVLSDFDVILSGHKHRPDYYGFNCSDKMDDRAAGRLLFNILRSHIGLSMVPIQLQDRKKGRKLSIALTWLGQVLALQNKVSSPNSYDFINQLEDNLDLALTDKKSFDNLFKNILKNIKILTDDNLTEDELDEIKELIFRKYNDDQRKQLTRVAKQYFRAVLRMLKKKTFHQINVGSTTKDYSRTNSPRYFNLYEITRHESGYSFESILFKNNENGFEEHGNKISILLDKQI